MGSSGTKVQHSSDPGLCLPALKPVLSRGIWFGDNLLDQPYSLIMAQIVLVILTSRLFYYVLKPLGQTKHVCNLLAGIILGPSVLGHKMALGNKLFRPIEIPLFDTIAVLGTIYSIFLLALKMDLTMVRKTAKNAVKTGLAGFLIPSTIASILTFPLTRHIHGINGGIFMKFFVTFSLSYTYFPCVAEVLDEFNLMASELGQLAMSSAVLEDVITWSFTMIQFLTMQRNARYGVEALVAFIAVVCFMIHVVRPAILLIIKNTPEEKEVDECYVVAIQLGVLVMAFISDIIGIKPTTGPLILGLLIPNGPPLGATLVNKTEYLVSEFLLPMFFFRVGFSTHAYLVRDWTSFTMLQIILIVLYIAKIFGVAVVAWCCNIRLKHGLLLGIVMNSKGLIELIVYSRWKDMKIIDEQCFTQMVLSALVVTMISTPILRFSYKPQVRLVGGASTKRPFVRNIQSMRTDSETFRILCCFHKEHSVPSIITFLEASNPTESSPISAFVVHAVELVGNAAPLLVPHRRHKTPFLCTNSPTDRMMRAFENYSKNSKGPVTIHAYNMVAPYKCMHETIFSLALENLVPLIIIAFHENHQFDVRQFNCNVPENSPCTVGILVDRGVSSRQKFTHFSYVVAVFFIGGPDDREALAYAERMSDNRNVGLTVFRFTLRNKDEGDDEEMVDAMLDESLADEFKLRNVGNDRLNWIDIEVDDGVHVMDSIRNLQGDYDLVMVGRRHAYKAVMEESMTEFMENSELGVFGDMLASSDFCGGMVNVLVMQESRDLGFRSATTKSSDSRFSFLSKRLLP